MDNPANQSWGKFIDPGNRALISKDPLGLFGRSNSGSSTPAGDAYAALTRDMWSSYVTNFVPYENKLISFATDKNAPADAMSRASYLVGQSFDQQQAASQRRLQGLGLTLDPQEQAASNRSFGLARSLADVTAQNNARDVTIQQQQNVLGNPVPTLPHI